MICSPEAANQFQPLLGYHRIEEGLAIPTFDQGAVLLISEYEWDRQKNRLDDRVSVILRSNAWEKADWRFVLARVQGKG